MYFKRLLDKALRYILWILTWNTDVLRYIQWSKEIKSPYFSIPMRIPDVLNNLRNQVFYILEKKECNKRVFRRMLKTFFFVSKPLDILRSWSTIKALQIVLVLIVMSILTHTHYKFISLTLLIACFALVCYIIADQFITLKQQYEDLRISCSTSSIIC